MPPRTCHCFSRGNCRISDGGPNPLVTAMLPASGVLNDAVVNPFVPPSLEFEGCVLQKRNLAAGDSLGTNGAVPSCGKVNDREHSQGWPAVVLYA